MCTPGLLVFHGLFLFLSFFLSFFFLSSFILSFFLVSFFALSSFFCFFSFLSSNLHVFFFFCLSLFVAGTGKSSLLAHMDQVARQNGANLITIMGEQPFVMGARHVCFANDAASLDELSFVSNLRVRRSMFH